MIFVDTAVFYIFAAKIELSKGIFQTNIYLDVKILNGIMLRYLLIRYHEYGERGWIEKGLFNRLLSVSSNHGT